MATERVDIFAKVHDAASRPLEKIADAADDASTSLRGVASATDDHTTAQRSQEREVRKSTKSTDKFTMSLNKLWKRQMGFRALRRYFMFPLIAAAIGPLISLVSALSAGLVGLAANLGRVAGVAASVPAGIGAILTSIGAVKFATHGVGDAVGVMTKMGATVEEVREATKELTPAQRSFAKALAESYPLVKKIRDVVAKSTLPALTRAVVKLRQLSPVFGAGMARAGAEVGGIAERGASMLTSSGWQRDLGTMFGRNSTLIRIFGDALLSLVSAMRHIVVAAGPMTEELAKAVARGAEFINTQARMGRESGRLGKFFDRAKDALFQWGRIISNLFAGLYHLFRGASAEGEKMTDSFERMTKRFREWGKSAEGQRKINEWMKAARPILREVGLLFRALWGEIASIDKEGRPGLVALVRALRTDLVPLLGRLIRAASDPRFIEGVVKLATAFGELWGTFRLIPIMKVIELFLTITSFVKTAAKNHQSVQILSDAFVTMGIAWAGYKLTGLSALVKLLGKSKQIRNLARAIRTLAAAIGGYTLLTMRLFFGMLIYYLRALGILLYSTPLGRLITVLVILGGVLWRLWRDNEGFRNAVKDTLASLADVGRWIWSTGQRAFNGLKDWLGDVRDRWNQITGEIKKAIATFNRWREVVRGWVGFAPADSTGTGGNRNKKAGDRPTRAVVDSAVLESPGTWLLQRLGLLGDTATARMSGTGGSLGSTMAAHASIDGATPGRRSITNVGYGAYASSDHRKGRALDLVGSGLRSYQANARRAGMYAEFHGGGKARHLHVAYGDTATPRTRSASARPDGGGATLVLNGPLIGTVHATSDVDVERAIDRGIRKWARERQERA